MVAGGVVVAAHVVQLGQGFHQIPAAVVGAFEAAAGDVKPGFAELDQIHGLDRRQGFREPEAGEGVG